MSIKQFKFVSPGVFVNEIDNSFIPEESDKIGPVIIGRTERGPSMQPIKVKSFSEYVQIFGNPIPGGSGKDVWRYGNYTAPTYAGYAAQAYLRNSTPATIVRLLGAQNNNNTSAGKAGWVTANQYDSTNEGGAYGLFLFPSASDAGTAWGMTGTLGAVWYMDRGWMELSGTAADDSEQAVSNIGRAIKANGENFGFRGVVKDTNGSVIYTTDFNFNETSNKFIRKVFNTNPTLTNQNVGIAASTSSYWLGESYENWLGNTDQKQHSVTSSAASSYLGVILPLVNSAGTIDQADHRVEMRSGESGWVFSQDLSEATGSFVTTNMQKLFRFHNRHSGLWEGQRLKVAVQDIRASTSKDNPYGTFTVVIRNSKDNDAAIEYLERFPECSLDPNSTNYIAKKIGDTYLVWNYEESRYEEYGNFPNRSNFIRVEMDQQVDAALTNESYLPFGYKGPMKYAQWFAISGAAVPYTTDGGTTATTVPVTGAGKISQIYGGEDSLIDGMPAGAGVWSFVYPGATCRVNSLTAPGPDKAYWGLTTQQYGSTSKFDENYYDYARPLPAAFSIAEQIGRTTNAALTASFIFTLDDLSASNNATGGPGSPVANDAVGVMYWDEGARAKGHSYRGTGSYAAILQRGFNKFVVPVVGGADGLDIHEMEPFRNSNMANVNETTSYEYNSIKRAIESVADPEVVDCNIITMPGLTLEGLNQRIIRTCEDRADSLAVIDLPGGYKPNTEAVGTEQDRKGNIDTVIEKLEQMQENTSYGCAYYPWVQIRDPQNGSHFWAPPSIVALGVMANTEKKAELWFAPAGFNRGGLSIGAAGIPVVNVRQRLTSKQRDKLYESHINPIASFPNEGLVVFGQKTLQITPSALDRINVRRLMNFIKKEVSRMASTVLFDQNVPATWNRFTSRVNPFLRSVKARFGLDDFKVVLDKTTTTPELIDRNIMYAKIFLKPTRAIEFIAIDFNISNSGAAFED